MTASDDPRLRILDPTAHHLADPILAALDSTEVVVHLGRDVTGSAAVAAGALVVMAARLFGRVTIRYDRVNGAILPTNWWGAPDLDFLASQAARTHRPGTGLGAARTLTVCVGAADVEVTDFGIGGGDFLARTGRRPLPVDEGVHHLGVHAAACLAISQLLGLILRDYLLPVVELDADYQLDLLTHQPLDAGFADPAATAERRYPPPTEVIFAGAGSVGSSAIALTATALAPAITGVSAPPGLRLGVVDLDRFDPDRNPFRYPALLGGESDHKAPALAARCRTLGLDAAGHIATVGAWVVQRQQPGVRGVLVSSVDTLDGRLQVADVLAEQTLSIGVSGLVLHIQRERMDGASACPFCDYVDTAPTLTQADVYVELTGLDLTRVLQLLEDAVPLTEQDITVAIAAGRIDAARAHHLIGQRLEDLVNRVYAEAPIRSASGQTVAAVAFPHVSWFAGVLAAVEIVKQVHRLPLLPGRVDVDLAGLPPGALRLMPQDPSGRCVCHSGLRRRAYRELYPDLPSWAPV